MMMKKTIALVIMLLSITSSYLATAQGVWDVRIESVNFVSSANTPVYPGSRYAELRVEVKFFANATRPVGTLSSLPPGFSPSYGYGLSVGGRDAYGADVLRVREGETVHFVYRLNVDEKVGPGTYMFNFQLSFVGDDGQSKMYYMWFPVTVAPLPEADIRIVDAQWSPAGYRGTYGTSLVLTIENGGESELYYATVRLSCPGEIICRDTASLIAGLQPGQRTTVAFSQIDIPESASAGTYAFFLTIDSTMRTMDDVVYDASLSLPFDMNVTEPPSWTRQVSVGQAVWGQVSPQPTFPDSLYSQLTVTVVNKGPYTVSSIQARLESSEADVISPFSSVTAPLGAGGSSPLSFYVNIRATELVGDGPDFNLSLQYTLDLGGETYVIVSDEFELRPRLERYPREDIQGVSVISAAWQNNYSVYPNTTNAVLVLQISNNMPFAISGLTVTLVLPEGFSFDGKRSWTFYVGSPIQPYGLTQAAFNIDVGGVEPGDYEAIVILDYVLQSGGPGKRMVSMGKLNLSVSQLGSPVEVISTRWVDWSPDVSSYGANLQVYLRNVGADVINSPVLIVELPPGITFAYTNGSRAIALPGNAALQTLAPPLTDADELVNYILNLQRQQASTAEVALGKGEVTSFVLPLNIMVNDTGTYLARAWLSFIDQWGNLREVGFDLPISILGSSRYIEVKIEGLLDVKSRYNDATLIVRNVGSGAAYNIYLTITSPTAPLGGQQASVLLVSPSTYYLDSLPPSGEVKIPLRLVFNPLVLQSPYGAPSMISYGVVPLEITLTYRDPMGTHRTFRNQIAVAVEPFIDVVLTDLKAAIQGGVLKISGTIINYGSATAYRLSVSAIVGNRTETFFVGDVEPGATSAFRIDRPVAPEERPASVILNVTYYNIYNELQSREAQVSVTEAPPPVTTTTTKPETFTAKFGVNWLIALLVIFLIISGILIFSLYRYHMRRLEAPASDERS